MTCFHNHHFKVPLLIFSPETKSVVVVSFFCDPLSSENCFSPSPKITCSVSHAQHGADERWRQPAECARDLMTNGLPAGCTSTARTLHGSRGRFLSAQDSQLKMFNEMPPTHLRGRGLGGHTCLGRGPPGAVLCSRFPR